MGRHTPIRKPRNAHQNARANKYFDGERELTEREITGMKQAIRSYIDGAVKDKDEADAIDLAEDDYEKLYDEVDGAISYAMAIVMTYDYGDNWEKVLFYLQDAFLDYGLDYYKLKLEQKFGKNWERGGVTLEGRRYRAPRRKTTRKSVKKNSIASLQNAYKRML